MGVRAEMENVLLVQQPAVQLQQGRLGAAAFFVELLAENVPFCAGGPGNAQGLDAFGHFQGLCPGGRGNNLQKIGQAPLLTVAGGGFVKG